MRRGLVHCDLSPLDGNERKLSACLDDLDTKDDKITELSENISRIRKTSEEMILMQTKLIRKLEQK